MVFNPLFLGSTADIENMQPGKANKLNGSGYLFSDIINVFMNTDEADSSTKVTQEFVGSAKIKEDNGTPVILSLVGETSINSADAQLNIEDLIPSALKGQLVKTESGDNVSEESLSVDQEQLEGILATLNQLLGIGKTEGEAETDDSTVDLSETTDILEESDGVFVIAEMNGQVFNINISKQTGADITGSGDTAETTGNLYSIKFSVSDNENSLANSAGSGLLASNSGLSESQLSFLPFESELAAENINSSSDKLKVFTYQNTGSESVSINNAKSDLKLVESITNQNKTSLSGNSTPQAETTQALDSNITSTEDADGVIPELLMQSQTKAAAEINPEKIISSTDGMKTAVSKNVSSKTNTEEENSGDKIVSGSAQKGTGKTSVSSFEGADEVEIKYVKGQNVKVPDSSKQNVESSKTATQSVLSGDKVNLKNSAETINGENSQQADSDEVLESLPKVEITKTSGFVDKAVEGSTKNTEKNNNEEISKLDAKITEEEISDNKDNEQLNVKINKTVKNITTVKAENTQQQSVEKTNTEKTETKTDAADEKVKTVQSTGSNEKNLSQNENSFKQSDENKNIPFDSNRMSSTQSKERFSLDAPSSNSNSDRVVKASEVMKEISKFIEKQENSTLTIKISPEALGKVKITMDITEQNVKANIQVENEAAKTMIEKNITELQNQMSKSGIQLTSVNISLSDTEQKNAKQFANKKKSDSFEIENLTTEESESEKIKMMGYNTVDYLA